MWIIILSVLLFLMTALCVLLFMTLLVSVSKSKQTVFYDPKLGVLKSESFENIQAVEEAMVAWKRNNELRKPCKGQNVNVCVAEGCYGEACIKNG